MNNEVMDIHVSILVHTVFISLGYKTRNRLLAHMVTLYLAY